jgi:hypothetical protein
MEDPLIALRVVADASFQISTAPPELKVFSSSSRCVSSIVEETCSRFGLVYLLGSKELCRLFLPATSTWLDSSRTVRDYLPDVEVRNYTRILRN